MSDRKARELEIKRRKERLEQLRQAREAKKKEVTDKDVSTLQTGNKLRFYVRAVGLQCVMCVPCVTHTANAAFSLSFLLLFML